MKATYSLHHINNSSVFGFNPDDYSRFKFGDDAVAKCFGTRLADGFIVRHLEKKPVEQQIVVISSPYSFIPTATFAMKTWFVYRLNRWLAENGYAVVQETKVHRTITYKEDYGELNAQERISLIGNDSFHIDKQFLEGKTLIFLDDIKITGSHERMIMKMVAEYGLQNDLYMLYFAELVNKSIHPNIENLLNYHQVKTIFDLEPIIKSGNFIINTRIVKYILNYNFECFCIFIENQDNSFVNLLYDMALGNGYHTIDAYAKNLNFITENLFVNNNNLIKHGN
ncbi:phosphoribosyltransferase family protein [Mucilaginibacter sp. OK098]|uniref:phosphoribosyltransferase family protein n=1 Tax=Mucilaginibacter sp. OK098 TaxID=1855297 RepID=UPI00091F1192|nr:phosphoribosyltransferase family protein [Mucilaginibacter sp. OK098]SHN21814.1 PRTase ComF-like [Mucilaginibacter sp. OK098]